MSAGPLIAEISIIFVLVAYLLNKYGNWSTNHFLVTINTFIAWYFAFIIISILPMDVSSTVYRQCLKNSEIFVPETTTIPENDSSVQNASFSLFNQTTLEYHQTKPGIECDVPWSKVNERVLPSLWRVVYWTAQALTWIILPMMQSYSTSGDFTIMGKIRTAIVENVVYYGSYLLLVSFFYVYLVLKTGVVLYGENLKVVCITASNTWGLFLLVLLLGHGLVEVPRSCWNTTKRGYTLNYLYFRASKLSSEKCEAEEKIDDLLEELQHINDSVPSSHPIQQHVHVMLKKFPENKQNMFLNRRHNTNHQFSLDSIGLSALAKLHKQAIRAIHMYNRTHCQWNMLCEQAFFWEDVARNETSRERSFKHMFAPQRPSIIMMLFSPKLEWYWQFRIRNWVYKGLCIILATWSFFVVWSEMTFFNQTPTLSLFALFIQSAKNDYIFIEVISMCTIAYLCVCAYYTVFRVRVLNYYYLAPHHQTNEYSLIFCGMMLCRLTPPLCLNFLGLIHLDSHVTKRNNMEETAYTRIMGHLDLIPIVSDFFNIYFPIAICLVCLATYFNLGRRLLHMIGFEQFMEHDEMTSDLIEEGKELIKREKSKRVRLIEDESRHREMQHRYRSGASQRNVDRDANFVSSPEENPHSELLQNVQSFDYTEEKRSNTSSDRTPIDGTDYDGSTNQLYGLSWNRIGRPSTGIFDDV